MPTPPGFVPLPLGRGGPPMLDRLHGRLEAGLLRVGFEVEAQHCNPLQACHGAVLLAFGEVLLPVASQHQADLGRHFLPTVSFNVDFLAAAALGAWVEGRVEVLRVTRRLVFAQGLITADGETVMRASGVFKLSPPPPPDLYDFDLIARALGRSAAPNDPQISTHAPSPGAQETH